MLTWLFSILFGKVMLLSAGPLMIIGGVALMVLGFRKYGLWVLVAGGVYIGAGVFWQDAYTSGRADERAIWKAAADKEQDRQEKAVATSDMNEAALAQARAENEKLIDERQARDVADIAREVEEEAATTPPAGPAPPAGTVIPSCGCGTDTQRDVERLRDFFR